MKSSRDYLAWVALGFALVATASAEYELACAVGYNQWVAAAVPGALDVWTIRAMRQHRDVLLAVGAMILVNALSHLVTAGLMQVNVPLVVGVSAIAPLVLYRVHHISREQAPAEAVEPVKVNTPAEAAEVNADTPAEVNTPTPDEKQLDDEPATATPQVICGAHRVYAPDVPPSGPGGGVDTEPAAEVSVEPGGRLDAQQARQIIEACWVNGVATREAARRATRVPSYVAKVYKQLDADRGPAPAAGQLALVGQGATA